MSDTFYRLAPGGHYVPQQEWSNGGSLILANGGTLTGATIEARGGAPHALGGTLVMLDPTLAQSDPDAPAFDTVSADMIETSGFDTFVAQGSLTSSGDVDLHLGRAFFLVSRPWDGQADVSDDGPRDEFAPVISSGGVLEIDAPYIRFDSSLQNVSTPLAGEDGDNSVILRADEIDISGAVLFDRSVADVQMFASGDVRLSGVQPWQKVFGLDPESVDNSLFGQLAVNGNLTITAGQVFPTTGSTFYITSAAEDGTITFARAAGPAPATPYSAGGNLRVQAVNIVQGGVVRVPIGSLTLGDSDPFTLADGGAVFAPGTASVEVLPGSITSVSADGMLIPYGTTHRPDRMVLRREPGPTSSKRRRRRSSPWAARTSKSTPGATVDVTGGGDLYAYEFISGVGGSHDVLDRLNDDEFSSKNGFQYPDGRQVYAIVPSLNDDVRASAFGNGVAALYDPIYRRNTAISIPRRPPASRSSSATCRG